jgi:hypothetical protein
LPNPKFRQLYFRDLNTGLGLLEDGTVVRFIYENRRGEGSAYTFRILEIDVIDERHAEGVPIVLSPKLTKSDDQV